MLTNEEILTRFNAKLDDDEKVIGEINIDSSGAIILKRNGIPIGILNVEVETWTDRAKLAINKQVDAKIEWVLISEFDGFGETNNQFAFNVTLAEQANKLNVNIDNSSIPYNKEMEEFHQRRDELKMKWKDLSKDEKAEWVFRFFMEKKKNAPKPAKTLEEFKKFPEAYFDQNFPAIWFFVDEQILKSAN